MAIQTTEEHLDLTERQFEDWRCLMAIATGISLSAIWLVLLLKSGSAGMLDLFMISLCLLFVWGASRLWPLIVLTGALGIAVFFIVGLRHNTLGLYQDSQSSPSLLHWILYIAGMAAMFAPFLMLAWRVARIAPKDRAIIALPKSSSFGLEPALLALLGIHPIVGHLPTLPRQIGAACLFFICQSILAFSIFMFIIIASTIFLGIGRAFECFSSAATIATCSGSLTGEIISPALWLGVPVGVAVVCRQIARRFARTSVEQLQRNDSRKPLLFLRSFSDDQVRLKKPKRSLFNQVFLLGEPRPLLDSHPA